MNLRQYFQNPALHITTSLILLSTAPTYGFKYDYVTCGSLIKLYNTVYDVRLHSHEVAYGTGSGQQSVTGVTYSDDANSYWQVRSPAEVAPCTRGEPIKCGSKVRFTHVNTKKNLHTHDFRSPLSGQQEVSCFGDGGVGDSLDTWEIQCTSGEWSRNNYVSVYHPETKKYLAISGKEFGRPIANQMEVIGSRSNNKWKAVEGVYIKPTMGDEYDGDHDEL